MLLNLSNHPHRRNEKLLWSDKQYNEGIKKFDKIIDYAFPNILPAWSIDEVEQEANKVLQDILNLYGLDQLNIMIAGEQSFLYLFINLCKAKKIPCYVSTSQRNTIMKDNGEKVVKFEFVKFRKVI